MADNSNKIAELTLAALEDKKGYDIMKLDVRDKTSLTDYFIIASAKSTPAVKALCSNVEEKLEKEGFFAKRKEGYTDGRWIVLDYGDVIVHMFNDETRLFYHLERLWQ